jgi:hypothetical protein
MKTMYHPAPIKLTDQILREGLDGGGKRAIVLIPVAPDVDEHWLNILEVEVSDDLFPNDTDAVVLLDGTIPPENIRLMDCDLSPAMAM